MKFEILSDKKEGWWRIVEQDQLKEVMRCCHPRGIREKNLQKTLQKFQEYACESCAKGDKQSMYITDQVKITSLLIMTVFSYNATSSSMKMWPKKKGHDLSGRR